MEVLLNNETVKIVYDAQLNCVTIDWNGYCCGDTYRQTLEDSLSLLSAKKANRLLLNQTQKDMFYVEDTSWAWESWYPKLVNALGTKGKFAVVFSKYYNTISLSQTQHSHRVNNKFFTSVKEAVYWLSQ